MTNESEAKHLVKDKHPLDLDIDMSRIVGQNLLERLTHVVDIVDYDPFEQLPPSIIAERIGTYPRWVHRVIDEMGIEPEEIEYDGKLMHCYPAFTLPLLQDEFEWRKSLRLLPRLLTISELAENIGRSWTWTSEKIEELNLVHKKTELRSSKESKLYRKQDLVILRHSSMAFPMEDGWHNIGRLTTELDLDYHWVQRRLVEANVEIQIRRSPLTGKLHEYYSPEALDVVTQALASRSETAPEAWITSEAFPEQVGKSYNWCRLRLSQFTAYGVPYADANGVERIHYPPHVIAQLQEEAQQLEQYPDAGDHITFSELARQAGKSKAWTRKRLENLEIKGELRKDKKGRVRPHYSASIVTRVVSD